MKLMKFLYFIIWFSLFALGVYFDFTIGSWLLDGAIVSIIGVTAINGVLRVAAGLLERISGFST